MLCRVLTPGLFRTPPRNVFFWAAVREHSTADRASSGGHAEVLSSEGLIGGAGGTGISCKIPSSFKTQPRSTKVKVRSSRDAADNSERKINSGVFFILKICACYR